VNSEQFSELIEISQRQWIFNSRSLVEESGRSRFQPKSESGARLFEKTKSRASAKN
jgi:hypothetical protein